MPNFEGTWHFYVTVSPSLRQPLGVFVVDGSAINGAGLGYAYAGTCNAIGQELIASFTRVTPPLKAPAGPDPWNRPDQPFQVEAHLQMKGDQALGSITSMAPAGPTYTLIAKRIADELADAAGCGKH